MILAAGTIVVTSACSGGGAGPTPTSATVPALDAYFAQYCTSAREVVREQRAIPTPAPGDAEDARRFTDANDRVLANWLHQEEQVVPPQAAATAHAELLDAIRAVATTTPARTAGGDD